MKIIQMTSGWKNYSYNVLYLLKICSWYVMISEDKNIFSEKNKREKFPAAVNHQWFRYLTNVPSKCIWKSHTENHIYISQGPLCDHQLIMALWRHMESLIYTSIAWGGSLSPDSTKSLPELMLTSHKRGSVAFTWKQFPKMHSWILGETCVRRYTFNSLWPSDTIWRHKSGSSLAQVMTSCLTAPSHYLNQCWLLISKVQWHSSQYNFTRDNSAISHWN